jgi:hypothetical protein
MVGAVILGIGGTTVLGYDNLKGRVDRLQAQLTTELQAGQVELEAGKASLQAANSQHDASLIAQAMAHFAAAKRRFEAAGQTADNSKLLRYLEDVPAVGSLAHSRHVAINGISDMGIALSDAGQGLADLDGQLIKPPSAGQAARNLLTVLQQATTSLVTIRADLQRAQNAASQVDLTVLPASQQPTFTKAADTIESALAGLDEFQRLVPVLEEVLGGNGARTYLIEQVNPAELRAGGGFIGTYSVVRADQGTLALATSGDAYDLADPRPVPGQPGFVAQPSPLREIIPTTSWSFVDSNVFPDFPSNAKAALSFVQPRIGTKIDGVISMDYYTVAKMLELTGPLAVPGYAVTVDSNNFVALAIQIDLAADPTIHKAVLSAIAGPLMARVSSLPPAQWPALITALNSLATEHHLQVYFSNDIAEKEMRRVGWSGQVNPTSAADFLMEVESNYSGDKANYYISRHYTVLLTRDGGVLHYKVIVDLVNGAPSGSFVRTYDDVNIRLYLGDRVSATSDNLRPVTYSDPSPPTGTLLLDGWLSRIQCCGASGQAVFKYDTPWSATRGFDKIYWQKQPGTLDDKIDVTWNDGNGHVFQVSGSLDQDQVITLSSTGVRLAAGQPAQAKLPSLTLG